MKFVEMKKAKLFNRYLTPKFYGISFIEFDMGTPCFSTQISHFLWLRFKWDTSRFCKSKNLSSTFFKICNNKISEKGSFTKFQHSQQKNRKVGCILFWFYRIFVPRKILILSRHKWRRTENWSDHLIQLKGMSLRKESVDLDCSTFVQPF